MPGPAVSASDDHSRRDPFRNQGVIPEVCLVPHSPYPANSDRYEEQHFMADMSRRSDFHWCRGRSGKCDWGQLLPEGTKTWECRKCGGLNCGLEHHIAHPGLTCKEFVVGVWVDPEAMRFIRRTHKQCPGAGCKAWIEKAGQCHKMECKASLGGCGIYFCWECKVIFPAGVHEHLYSCEKRNGYCGGKGVPKPGQKDPKYKPNWDKDLEFVGTGKEYSGSKSLYHCCHSQADRI